MAKEHGLGASAVYNHNRAHIEENYRKIIGSGVYADIDELLKKCTQGDAESAPEQMSVGTQTVG